jgi:hypothetical protein
MIFLADKILILVPTEIARLILEMLNLIRGKKDIRERDSIEP